MVISVVVQYPKFQQKETLSQTNAKFTFLSFQGCVTHLILLAYHSVTTTVPTMLGWRVQ